MWKCGLTLKVHAFLFSMVIQDIVVIVFGTKPVITPTYYYPAIFIDHWDIIFISQMQNFTAKVLSEGLY